MRGQIVFVAAVVAVVEVDFLGDWTDVGWKDG